MPTTLLRSLRSCAPFARRSCSLALGAAICLSAVRLRAADDPIPITSIGGTFTWTNIYMPGLPYTGPDGTTPLSMSGTYLIPHPSSGNTIGTDTIIVGDLTLDREFPGSGSASATFSKAVSTSGSLTVTATAFTGFNPNRSISGVQYGISLGGALTAAGAGDFSIFTATGVGGIIMNGTGNLNLSNNALSGNMVMNAGRVGVADSGAFGTGSVVLNGTTLNNSSGDATLTVANNLSITADSTIQPTGRTFAFTGAVNLGSSTHTLTTDVVNAGGGVVYTGTVAMTGDVSGSAGLTKTGGSKLSLSGSNTFSGPISVPMGTLEFTSIANVGAASSALGAPANATDGTIALGSNSGSPQNTNYSGTLRYTGSGSTSDRAITMSGGGGILDASGTGAFVLTGGISGNSLTLTGSSTAANSISGVIADDGSHMSVTKTGSGTWLLGNTNTYSGPTTINDGTLRIATAGALGSNGIYLQGMNAVLEFASNTALTTSGFLNLSSGTLSLDRATDGAAVTTHIGTQTNLGGENFVVAGPHVTSGTPTLVFDGKVNLSNYSILSVASGASVSFGEISIFSGPLAINGAGSATITGAVSGSIWRGGTGTLTLASTSSGGAYTVTGGTLNYSNASSGGITVSGTGTLKGTGTINGLVDIKSGGTLSPGNSPGVLQSTFADFNAGGNYVWEINSVTGSAGTNWDLLSISNQLYVEATSANKFTIKPTSLNKSNAPGTVFNFASGASYTFTIATAASGFAFAFDPSAFTIDMSNFQNAFGGTWSLAQDGNNLNLVYAGGSAIPEPSTCAALCGLAALGIALWRRRSSAAASTS